MKNFIALFLLFVSTTAYAQCPSGNCGISRSTTFGSRVSRLSFYQPPYSYLNSGQADIEPWQPRWSYARPVIRPRTLVVSPYNRPLVVPRSRAFFAPGFVVVHPPQAYYYGNVIGYQGNFSYGTCN